MTLLDLLARGAGRAPHRPAFVFRERRVSYADLQRRVLKLAECLRGLGVKPGDRVVLMMPNVPEFATGYFGILAAEGTVVPLNPLLKSEEVRYILEDSGATAMVCLQASQLLVQEAHRELTRRVPCLVLDVAPESPGGSDIEAAPSPGIGFPQLDAEDVAACLYTSGTTGRPKGALLTHRNLLANVESFHEVLNLAEGEVFLAVLPLFHAYGGTVLLLEPLSVGATIVLEPRFIPDLVLRAIAEHRVSFFAGVPSMFAVLAEHPRPALDFTAWRLCISGGAPLPPPVLEAFEAKYGVHIYEGYGPTECAPVLTVNPPGGNRKVGSVGPPLPRVELQVVDERGERLSPGEVGEIVARGPNVMKGYLNRPEETAEALRGGWYHTGDLGRMDQDGYFYIVDRQNDLILVGGLNVYPREVELVLGSHPAVAEAAVIGIPDRVRGEVPRGLVILKNGQKVGAHELLRWCRQRLANYKVPRTITFVPDLPRTATGKVLKAALRERGV
jgi:long-chain acyl-CoA synthetase